MEDVINCKHQSTHYGRNATLQWIHKFILGQEMQRIIQKMIQKCIDGLKIILILSCQRNPDLRCWTQQKTGRWYCDARSHWKSWVFTSICGHLSWLRQKHSFIGLKKASEVVNGPPKETILRFGLPVSIPSNNWRFFLARMTREVPRALNLHQKLHTSWWSQSTGKMEKMNHTLKKDVAKICQSDLTWDKALLVALLQVKMAHRSSSWAPIKFCMGDPSIFQKWFRKSRRNSRN